MRAVAILRVVVWHTYGYAPLSYLIASMPAMFFVAGSLMAHSLERGRPLDVLYRRFRRILIPLWVLAAVAIAVMLAYDRASSASSADFHYRDILGWVFPLVDPRGSEWGLTWWTALWYLRCTTWLLLVSPALLWVWRKTGPALLLLPLAGIALGEGWLPGIPELPWQVKDATLFGTFWLLGFAYTDGWFELLSKGVRALLCVLFAAAAAGWLLTQDVPGGIVNASYPMHLFVGLAWLFGALAAEGVIGRVAQGQRMANAVYWVNERALTIYLWQAAGLFCMYRVLWVRDYPSLVRDGLAIPVVASVTFLGVLLFGWVEDVAAGRGPRLWPRIAIGPALWAPTYARAMRLAGGLAVASAIGAIIVTAGGITDEASSVAAERPDLAPLLGAGLQVKTQKRALPMVPSGVGLQLRTQKIRVLPEAPRKEPTSPVELPPVSAADLESELNLWLEEWGLPGATVTLRRLTGEEWTGATGFHPEGEAFQPNAPYKIASVTKTFTVALVMRLVERHLVNLDDPVDLYVPEFPYTNRFTIRNLIQHTSGLVSTGEQGPSEALETALEAQLQFDPDTDFLYSTPGYYLLGLAIERVTGKPYTQVLHEELIDPLGLTATMMDEELDPIWYSTHPYWAMPEFEYRGLLWSSGGLWSTTSDLARWALALWGSDAVVSPSTRDAMTTFRGVEFAYTGLGTYPFCPCWQEGTRLRAELWGHLGANGLLEYDPQDSLALAMNTAETVVDENVLAALDDLSARLRQLVKGRQLVPATAVTGPSSPRAEGG